MTTKYKLKYIKNHPKGGKSGQIGEHILVMEELLGHYLPKGYIVHHKDRDGLNNKIENLVLCKDQAAHSQLHRREDALAACGHEDWRKCNLCQEYDDPENMYISVDGYSAKHYDCKNPLRADMHLILDTRLKNTIKAAASLSSLSLSAFIEKILYNYLSEREIKHEK